MAGRLAAARSLALFRILASNRQPIRARQPSHFLNARLFAPVDAVELRRNGTNGTQRHYLCTSVAQLPSISDSDVLKALHKLMAVNWHEIDEVTKDAVAAALSKKTDDVAGQEELANAWRAAEAVEKFSGTLISLRMALDELNGLSGEKVRPLPPTYMDALKAVHSKYKNYLATFKPEEYYLKKKVEIELGGILIHIRQRCSGLGPEWGNVSLLGTSGLSGSFIEHRAQ